MHRLLHNNIDFVMGIQKKIAKRVAHVRISETEKGNAATFKKSDAFDMNLHEMSGGKVYLIWRNV